MSASQFNVSSQVTDEDLSFPTEEDLVNYTSRIIPIMAKVPAELITENLTTSSCKLTITLWGGGGVGGGD